MKNDLHGPVNVRDRLRQLFEIGRHPLEPEGEEGAGLGLIRLRFQTPAGDAVAGWLMTPQTPPPWSVVLVIHAHGDRYDIGARELIDGRPALPSPLGPDLAARGIASICVDLPCFGDRAGQSESAATKAALWRGGSLAGQMLGELTAQIGWIASDSRFDRQRIGVYGLSMGATLGYWLAAVEPRVAALAHLCCLADIDRLIATGAHDLHGIYLTIPGLPALARNGQIAGLVAPRPQLFCLGGQDPLTPPDALGVALADLRAGYAGSSDSLEVMIDPNVGHVETPAMRARVLDFFAEKLV